MILEFLKETETKRGNGKTYKVGDEVFVVDYEWGEEQIKSGNAIRTDNNKKSFSDKLNDENRKLIKEKREKLKSKK